MTTTERVRTPDVAIDLTVDDGRPDTVTARLLAILRVAMGWVFLWAFIDKAFGLGFATAGEDAWIRGGSPTFGFLNFGTEGKALHDLFAGLSGTAADWLFMGGLLGIGLALILGIGIRVAALAGGTMLVLMWAASLPLENNPFFDDHLAYALVLALLAVTDAGRTWGLGTAWADNPVVQRHPALR